MTIDVLSQLDAVRPRQLRRATLEPLYAEGWLFERRRAVESIWAHIDDCILPAVAIGHETPATYERYRASHHRSAHAANSGFIIAGIVRPGAIESGELTIGAQLDDGSRVAIRHSPIPVEPFEAKPVDAHPPAQVAIAMATFNPPGDLFERQIDSIRGQIHDSWSCIISDDGSDRTSLASMRRAVEDDARFLLLEHSDRVGFYLNFERALAATPESARYVALADQDDVWRPHKLVRLIDALEAQPGAVLSASDVRLVATDGAIVSDTFYAERSPTFDDPYSLFLVNSLVGASMVFRRSLLDVVLPFPRAIDGTFHDHWLARAALMAGGIAFVPEALHDYVQHGGNVLGAARSQSGHMRHLVTSTLRRGLAGVPPPAEWRRCFVLNVIEPWLAAHLLIERLSVETPEWLQRITNLETGQVRELCQLMVDHRRENRDDRRHREWVELSLVAGRAWAIGHRPMARRA